MAVRLRDLSGEHTAVASVQKLAEKTTFTGICFIAPFKCKVKEINVIMSEAWVGVESASDYETIVLNDEDGSALGTISGSPAGTPVPARTITAIYDTDHDLEKDETLTVTVGTIGAGSTAPPAFSVQTVFVGR